MLHKKFIYSLLSLIFVLGSASAAVLGEDADLATISKQRYSYPLTECVISGKAFTAERPATSFVVNGRMIKTCCTKCEKKVRANPAEHIAKIDAAVIEQQRASYPFDKCLVSDEPLDAMGKPLDYVHGTRLIRMCCKGCVKEFKKNPEKILHRINAAMIEHQRKDYPFEKCLISDEPLDAMGEPIDRLYGTTLVRMCCKGCIKEFEKHPSQYLARIHDARNRAGSAADKRSGGHTGAKTGSDAQTGGKTRKG